MLHILDELSARPGRLDELQRLLRERYLPGAQARGMRLVGQWVAPPSPLAEHGSEWLLLWELSDVDGWWDMRARASRDPAVLAFWREADGCLAGRARRMLPPSEPSGPPEPRRRLRLPRGATRGHRWTALLTLHPGVSEAERGRLEALLRTLPQRVPGLLESEVGRNLPGTLNGGDYTLDLLFAGEEPAARWRESGWSDREAGGAWDELIRWEDAVHHEPLEGGLDAPRIASPVKRTLCLRVEPAAPPDRVARFEQELAAMPDHIPAIRNWSLARVGLRSRSRWTHVWEQEFAALEGLAHDYMVHPYHWAWVDRWFDPESPERIVDLELAHVFCRMPRSVLAWGAEGASRR
jgi:hypothetical protein